jgi:hypothetical protein
VIQAGGLPMALIEDVSWISEVHMAQILKFLHWRGCMIYIFFSGSLDHDIFRTSARKFDVKAGVMIDFSVNFYVQTSS